MRDWLMHLLGSVVRALARSAALAITLAGCADAPPASAPLDDELPAAQDNGALGQNPFGQAEHVVPIEACADDLRASDGSLVIRVLPRGPTLPDGALAFTAGVCVYLPPGYAESGLRYPVLYLLHGGGGDQADWVTFGGIRSIMDGLVAADPANAAIVVMPDGAGGEWYDRLDAAVQNERYVLDHVIAYVDRHFRTIAERDGRAIDGLSNGGYGAMHLAAKGPDRFVAAGGMSSNLAALHPQGPAGAGDSPVWLHGRLPADLVGNLAGLDLTLDVGTICLTDRAIDDCLTWTFEQVFVPANSEFVSRLAGDRGPDDGAVEYRETEGGHSWRWWPLWLRERHLPFLLARLADPRRGRGESAPAAPRAGFRYRSIAPEFSVWGYDVRVERAVLEFLDLSDVRADGLAVRGSGRAIVRTAALYRPGRAYVVSGTGGDAERLVADEDGRLELVVDLGPSHTFEQFSPEADAREAAGAYWTTREVAIAER